MLSEDEGKREKGEGVGTKEDNPPSRVGSRKT